MKRVKVKHKCPNPLFISWLEAWREDAKSRGSEMQYCFMKALNSLEKFPLTLHTGKECMIVKNFGPKLCAMIDKKLTEYKEANIGNPAALEALHFQNDSETHKNSKEKSDKCTNMINNKDNNHTGDKIPNTATGKRAKRSEATEQPAKKTKTPNAKDDRKTQNPSKSGSYIPAWRSGGYAILLTLYHNELNPDSLGYMSKADLQADAQKHCDHTLRKPEPGSRYSAWSSMSTLIQKGLVSKNSNPAKYSLTEVGLAVAMKLSSDEARNSISGSSSSQCNGASQSSSGASSSLGERILPQPIDDNILIIDSPGSSSHDENEEFPFRLDSFSSSAHVHVTKNIQEKRKTSPNDNRREIQNVPEEKRIPSRQIEINNHLQTLDINERNNSQESIASGDDLNVIFRPKTFDVILLIDNRETMGRKTRPKDDPTLAELTDAGVRFEVRNLKIGDFTWIARCRSSAQELVLPYIVERKRMDDFGSSIKDGRYHEQKFRLKRSGIQNVTYLIENHGNNQFVGLPMTTLSQAAINTSVQDGFNVKYTKSHRESMSYLASITELLTKIYPEKTLVGCKKENLTQSKITNDVIQVMLFKDFNKAAAKMKTFKAKDMFIRHLLQLKGISVEKALAIVNFYPTPRALKKAYDEAGSSGENLLTRVQFGSTNRQFGPTLSKTVHQFYTRRDF